MKLFAQALLLSGVLVSSSAHAAPKSIKPQSALRDIEEDSLVVVSQAILFMPRAKSVARSAAFVDGSQVGCSLNKKGWNAGESSLAKGARLLVYEVESTVTDIGDDRQTENVIVTLIYEKPDSSGYIKEFGYASCTAHNVSRDAGRMATQMLQRFFPELKLYQPEE